ncbi:putative protein phosphatase 2C 8 [Camellia lanceoleosa]|uniref:Uncharacterized protein n=1 Tax=Camellia lanceoleosa TaxID=1840588 RepID=A0ACC0H328_9ERIC|nr:putative protein phosphatase 2C 8 [Camellia lanceoleosa]
MTSLDWQKVMVGCFEKMDKEVSDYGRAAKADSAAALSEVTVGLTAMVGEEEVVVANCGNSRVVLSRGGVAISLADDHKPDRPDELERIEGASRRVINWNGASSPGDVVSNNFTCQVVRRCLDGRMKRRKLNGSRFSEAVNESHIAEAATVLTELAMARGSRDNISVVVVELNNSGKCRV